MTPFRAQGNLSSLATVRFFVTQKGAFCSACNFAMVPWTQHLIPRACVGRSHNEDTRISSGFRAVDIESVRLVAGRKSDSRYESNPHTSRLDRSRRFQTSWHAAKDPHRTIARNLRQTLPNSQTLLRCGAMSSTEPSCTSSKNSAQQTALFVEPIQSADLE